MYVIHSKPTLVIASDEWHGVARFGLSKKLIEEIENEYPVINVLWDGDSQFASYNVCGGDEFQVPDEDELQLLERDYPWVGDTWGPTRLAEFQASYCFTSICRKGTKASDFQSTYSIKHDVENVSRLYVSEGALALGAQFAGFTAKPADEGGWELDLLVDDMYCCLLRVLNRAKRAITSPNLSLI